ncbi:MAG: PspC domain-containing protein [Bryobacteraceae bacterium]
MFCTKCGVELRETDRFCPACGKPIDALPEAVADPPQRRLRRIMSQKKIAGICAGFAEYFGMDITLMRIIWVALLVLPPSIGGIAYIVGWLAMPKD